MDQTEADVIAVAIDALHCPACGQLAVAQGQTSSEVFDIWACDTEDCPFHWETGDRTWTLGLSD